MHSNSPSFGEDPRTVAERLLELINAAERNSHVLFCNPFTYLNKGERERLKKRLKKLHTMINDVCLYADDVLIERRYKHD